jgi:CheY-specific phosphatase CheX
MSSTNWRTSTPADAGASLGQALTRVLEEGFFGIAEEVTDDSWAAICESHQAWLEAAVGFRGELQGTLRCRLPRALAGELASAFVGIDIGKLDPGGRLVDDLTGEFANMVCGCWLTTLDTETAFDLDHPTVTAVPEVSFGPSWRRLEVNGMPLGIELIIREA